MNFNAPIYSANAPINNANAPIYTANAPIYNAWGVVNRRVGVVNWRVGFVNWSVGVVNRRVEIQVFLNGSVVMVRQREDIRELFRFVSLHTVALLCSFVRCVLCRFA